MAEKENHTRRAVRSTNAQLRDGRSRCKSEPRTVRMEHRQATLQLLQLLSCYYVLQSTTVLYYYYCVCCTNCTVQYSQYSSVVSKGVLASLIRYYQRQLKNKVVWLYFGYRPCTIDYITNGIAFLPTHRQRTQHSHLSVFLVREPNHTLVCLKLAAL